MRVAAIDIGTNSVLLLVAERDAAGTLVPVLERATITRLGEAVDRTRMLAPAAIERTLACLSDYAHDIARLGCARVAAVGTSAMRDARGGEAFVERARALLGSAPRVISGEEEARLTFAGALGGLGLSGEVTVFDVGGGSTEIVRGVLGEGAPSIAYATSLDVGSVRLFERFVTHDPPAADELARARGFVASLLADVPAPAPDRPLVGIAGTVTTIAAVARAIDPYDGARVHGMRLSAAEVNRVAADLARLPLAARRALPGMEPKRADVIVTGAALVSVLLGWSGADELVVSDRGVRWGLAESLSR